MNEIINNILKRRSIRGFENKQIPKDVLEKIMECGLNAPSALNTQNWYFCAIQNSDLIKEINNNIKSNLPENFKERMLQRFNGDENYSVFYNAPTVVYVFGEDAPWSEYNVSFATQNIVLSAESLNVNSCIIGMGRYLFEKENNYNETFGVPENYKPMYAIALGYSDKKMDKPERINNKVKYI